MHCNTRQARRARAYLVGTALGHAATVLGAAATAIVAASMLLAMGCAWFAPAYIARAATVAPGMFCTAAALFALGGLAWLAGQVVVARRNG